jgi:hypothetical protein
MADVPVPTAPIQEPGTEIETALDLDAIDLEARARFNVRPLVALKVSSTPSRVAAGSATTYQA